MDSDLKNKFASEGEKSMEDIEKINKKRNNESYLLVADNKYTIPNNVNEVLESNEKEQWLQAMKAELDAFKEFGVYEKVKIKDITAPLIKGRWVYSVKDELNVPDIFKSRLVAKGFTQEVGQNYLDTYSPVINGETIRFLLALAAINGWEIHQLDAKNAFLNGKLENEIYFKPPPMCKTKKDEAWLLKKAIYGLKNAPLIFYKTFSETLIKCGFTVSKINPCLIYHEKLEVYVALYVDDLLVVGSSIKNINKAKDIIKSKFVMKDMGEPKMFLGMNIKRVNKNHIKISMKSTLERIQQSHGVKVPMRKIKTPLAKGFDRFDEKSEKLNEEEHHKYRSLIGKLLHIANNVRLDISFAVSILSRHLQTPRKCHLAAAQRVLQYLIQTKNKGIHFTKYKYKKMKSIDYRVVSSNKKQIIFDYGKKRDYEIRAVTDASYGNEENKKSQYGYIVMLNDNVISWASKKQSSISLSTAEAEYVGMSEAAKTTLYFRNLIKELNMKTGPGVICSDNIAALQMSAIRTISSKTKHIEIRFYHIQDCVKKRKLKLEYVNTTENIADGLTKILDGSTNSKLNKLIFSNHKET